MSEVEKKTRPFLKWVGGKRSVLPDLLKRFPASYDVYNEFFLGGGALFFDSKPKRAVLADINPHLIACYRAVRDDVDAVIELLKNHVRCHNKQYYLRCRELFAKEKDSIKTAALLIYLNKTCYNGLYRVNKSGKFNVPIGSYENPAILDEVNLRNAKIALQNVTIEQRSFDECCDLQKGDFYYFDPPYHRTYASYNFPGFGDNEHEKLARLCDRIDKAGGYFMLSNSDTFFIRQLYGAYSIEDIKSSSFVSCKAEQRGKKSELLIRNYHD